MNSKATFQVSMISVLAILIASAGAPAESRISLDTPSIVVDAGQPSFVQHAVQELAGYLKEITGKAVRVSESTESNVAATIAVGPKPAERILGTGVSTQGLGAEGYVLKSTQRDGRTVVVVAGAEPRGTMAGVYALMKAIEADGRSAFLSQALDRRSRPTFAVRGLHFNGWPFNYPHSFRRWKEEDWQRYLDILAYQGVNLFYLWPFIEIMPVPLSPEDQAYLEECRRIVDYAHSKHGMQVWIMQCTNRVAKDRCNVADPKARPYWRPSQEDLKPSDPGNYEKIMTSREAYYRILNNVDGVCNIDSDPGWCFECPLEDYARVLQGCRDLLNRHNLHGKDTRLMSWMWCGWGITRKSYFEEANHEATVRLLKQSLVGNWGLVSGRFGFLPICRRNGLMGQTMLLPYGMIEDEPSYPWTNVRMDRIRTEMDEGFPANPDLTGVIGNVQTPLLQLPHVYFFTSSLWDQNHRRTSERDSLLELGGLLYPEHAQLIADAYLALKSKDAATIKPLADKLDDLTRNNRLGRLGIIGRKLFPDHRVVAQAIVLQLRLRAGQERLFASLTPETSRADCTAMLLDCLEAYLAWDLVHGWHDFWGWTNIPLVPISTERRFPEFTLRLARCLREPASLDACLADVEKALSAKYPPKIVEQGCITPLRNTLSGILRSRAPWAKTTASVAPDPGRYPPRAANDGSMESQYWPGALVQNNEEWLQLTWEAPETIRQVIVRFLKHPSMPGRTIRLQRETAPGKWEDLATTTIPAAPDAPHAIATFDLPTPVQLDRIRIVNLLDVYEVEVN